jgi:hypothetical protein
MLFHMSEYDFEPPRRTNTMLVLVSVAAIVIALIVASIIIYKHSHRNKPVTEQAKSRVPNPSSDFESSERRIMASMYKERIGIVLLFLAGLAGVVSHVAMLVWVVRDSRSRGSDAGAVWAILILAFGLIGVLVYAASRSQGPLVICNHCMNRIPAYAKRCHHCSQDITKPLEFAPGDSCVKLIAVTLPLAFILFVTGIILVL